MSNEDSIVAMPITPPPNMMQQLNADMATFVQRQKRVIIRRLQIIGEQAITIARTSHRYLDQTGNLTSSIGYVITENGSVIFASSFNAVKEGNDGAVTGRELALQLASEFSSDYALIVVAGMHYAAHVEARGLGGMTAAELDAKNEVERLVNKLNGR